MYHMVFRTSNLLLYALLLNYFFFSYGALHTQPIVNIWQNVNVLRVE